MKSQCSSSCQISGQLECTEPHFHSESEMLYNMTNKVDHIQSSGILGTFQHLDTLLGVLPTAIAVVDTDMRYMMVNKQWLQDYNLTDRDVIKQSHYEMIPDLHEVWKVFYVRALNGESFTNNEDRFDRADGSVIFLSWQILPWFSDDSAGKGKPSGLI